MTAGTLASRRLARRASRRLPANLQTVAGNRSGETPLSQPAGRQRSRREL